MDPRQLQFEIEQLLTGYVLCIDNDTLESWPDFFVDPCLYQVIPRENWDRGLDGSLIYCDSRAMMRDRILSLREANIYPHHSYRHLVSAVRVTPTAPDEAGVEANYVVFLTRELTGESILYNTGRYLDRVIHTPNGWRFREKTVVFDTTAVDSVMVIPL